MRADTLTLSDQLSKLRIFSGLDETQLAHLEQYAHPVRLRVEEELYLDATEDYPFFVVCQGRVCLKYPESSHEPCDRVFKTEDIFGADVLFYGEHLPYRVIAREKTELIRIESAQLGRLMREMPVLKANLKTRLDDYRDLQAWHLDLHENESLHLITRKHPAYLLVSLIGPLAVSWMALLAFLLAQSISTPSFRLIMVIIGGLILLAGLLWGGWQYLDWRNDHYIVTDERVAWLERVIFLYDSRQEAPLFVVRSVETRSTLVGRLLGYGDVIIQAFVGQVVFESIPDPRAVRDLIEELRQLDRNRQQDVSQEDMRSLLQRKIEAEKPASPDQPTQESAPAAPTAPPSQEIQTVIEPRSFWQDFSNYFKTRIEEGETITYRKHLYVLFTMTWLPALTILVIIGAAVYFFWQRVSGVIASPNPVIIILTGLFLLVVPVLWWLYNYIDWRNDIYRITPDRIIDSERKPLGDEISKSAPLESIISMDYERLGLLGILFNYGNVAINVGADTRFVFFGINDPARAQREIYNHIFDLRRKKARLETQKNWDEISDFFATYHKLSGQSPPQEDAGDNPEF